MSIYITKIFVVDFLSNFKVVKLEHKFELSDLNSHHRSPQPWPFIKNKKIELLIFATILAATRVVPRDLHLPTANSVNIFSSK